MPVWFETKEELDQAVADVAGLSPSARKVLATMCEITEKVGRYTATVRKLEDLGFLFTRGANGYDDTVSISVTLWGEEAMDGWETAREASVKPKPMEIN